MAGGELDTVLAEMEMDSPEDPGKSILDEPGDEGQRVGVGSAVEVEDGGKELARQGVDEKEEEEAGGGS